LGLEKKALISSTACIADSNSIIRDLSESLEIPELHKKSSVITISVPPKEFVARDIEKKKNFVTFIGRIDRRKNLNLVLDIWELLLKSNPEIDWELSVVSNPGDDPIAEERLRKLNSLGKVNWIRNASDQKRNLILASSRILLVPSTYESFGIVAVEGMQFGNAILATRVGGLQEIVPGNAGMLLDSTNPNDWLEALIELIDSPKHLRSLNYNAFLNGQKFGLGEQSLRLREFLSI
jgi:glycosyltransferase involved in cell wall biosynthesis